MYLSSNNSKNTKQRYSETACFRECHDMRDVDLFKSLIETSERLQKWVAGCAWPIASLHYNHLLAIAQPLQALSTYTGICLRVAFIPCHDRSYNVCLKLGLSSSPGQACKSQAFPICRDLQPETSGQPTSTYTYPTGTSTISDQTKQRETNRNNVNWSRGSYDERNSRR